MVARYITKILFKKMFRTCLNNKFKIIYKIIYVANNSEIPNIQSCVYIVYFFLSPFLFVFEIATTFRNIFDENIK